MYKRDVLAKWFPWWPWAKRWQENQDEVLEQMEAWYAGLDLAYSDDHHFITISKFDG
jgi:phage terminase large subunit-like protein